MNNWCICWFFKLILLRILIFKGLTARRLYKSFGVKGLKLAEFAFKSRVPVEGHTRHNTPILNILSTTQQLSISQKALGTLPEDGNVMPKHIGTTTHN
jgi:hypothetical protein